MVRSIARGRATWIGRLLAAALLLATLSSSARPPTAGAQELSADDLAWIDQRMAEAAVYLGGTLHPEEMPDFEDWYQDCLISGLRDGNPRSATLDLCAETYLTPLAEPQEWLAQVDDDAASFLDILTDEGVEPPFAGLATAEYRDCLKGLARTRFLDVEEAQTICENEARTALEVALAPPPPTPTPLPPAPTELPALPTLTPAPTLPRPTVVATAPPLPSTGEIVYRADQSGFSAENVHLTWINSGPIDTRLSSGSAEIRLDAATQRMRGPATLSVGLVSDIGPDTPLCGHSRFQVDGTAPPADGSLAEGEGVILNFDGTLVRNFDGQNCPPEKEFRTQGGVASLRYVLGQDPDRNEPVVAACSLALTSSSREDCQKVAIVLLRPVRP
jgi:hypothetical protein